MRLSGKFTIIIIIIIIIIILPRYFAKKNSEGLFKYRNTPKKHNKEHKQLSFRCKAMNFCLNISLLKKQDVMSNFHQNNKPEKHK